jgi:hypothetical protein
MPTDGRMQFNDGLETVSIPVPEYGYKSIIDLPFDIDTLDTGVKTVYAYDSTLDKYHCECDVIMTPLDMAAFNDFIKNHSDSRALNNITMLLNANCGFFPFTPLHGDSGPFTVGLIVSKSEKIQDNPFQYFKVSIAIYKQGSFPAYSLPSQINEGSLSIGTVTNIRFPENYFDPTEDNGILYNVDESGSLNFIDRGKLASSWQTVFPVMAGTGKTAAILNYLINTSRSGVFQLSTQPGHYAFGADKEGAGTNYNVILIQDQIEITHTVFNRFEFPLTIQYQSNL